MHITTRIELNFAGLVLPVSKNEQGQEIVPLKPITDAFGLVWQRQYKKITTPYFKETIGVCNASFVFAGQSREMVAIRMDRVSPFILTINPRRVRGGGNIDGAALIETTHDQWLQIVDEYRRMVGGNAAGADFLEQKQEEWDDLIHDYEVSKGEMFSVLSREEQKAERDTKLLLQTIKLKAATKDDADRQILNRIRDSLATRLVIPVQHDLLDAVA